MAVLCIFPPGGGSLASNGKVSTNNGDTSLTRHTLSVEHRLLILQDLMSEVISGLVPVWVRNSLLGCEISAFVHTVADFDYILKTQILQVIDCQRFICSFSQAKLFTKVIVWCVYALVYSSYRLQCVPNLSM